MKTSQSLTGNIVWDNFLFPFETPNSNTMNKHKTKDPLNGTIDNNNFDLVIGNPPWQVLGGIRSPNYKEKIRNLAQHFGILPRARNLPNIEVSALFLFQSMQKALKETGTIAFLISNAIVNGSQHNGTRAFHEMDQIRIWKFTKDLFRIHNICFIAQKNIHASRVNYPSITVSHHDILSTNDNSEFIRIKTEEYVPITTLRRADGTREGAEKLIPVSAHKKLLPRSVSKKNHYFARCRKGADLYPRSFISVNVMKKTNSFVNIEPNMRSPAKSPWNFPPYHQALVEPDHIFHTVKSDASVPFLILDETPVFLPITSQTFLDFDGNPVNVPNINARSHYEHLISVYAKHKRARKRNPDLWGNLNFRNKLTHPDQLSPLKVVTPASAGFVKAAMIRNPTTLIDVSLYYVPVSSIEEGYYLLGILNAPCVAEDVRIRSSEGAGGGVRNLHKRPWEITIPAFIPTEELHKAIQNQAREMELQARKIAVQWREKEYLNKKNKIEAYKSIEDVQWKKLIVQKLILSHLKQEYNTLNELVTDLLTSPISVS
jgi:hypothetical protein